MIKKNLFAAYAGTIWNVLLPLIITPLLLKALGREAFGLIAVSLLLHSILSLMEVGLSSALSRTFAEKTSNTGDDSKATEMHNLLRTFEYFYLFIVFIVISSVLIISPFLATHWFKEHALPYDIIWQSLSLIGLWIGVRFFISLYSGGLAGLQRQVLLNTIAILLNTISSFGGVALLIWVNPDPRLYFLWLAIAGIITALMLRIALNHVLPARLVPIKFDRAQWKNVKKFVFGMSSLTFTTLAVTQVDKLLLSRLLPLRDFGLYSIAANAANSVQFLATPVLNVTYPKLTQQYATGNEKGLIDTYQYASRLVALLVFPIGITLATFSQEVLNLWLRDSIVASELHWILTLLVIGNCFLTCFMMMPYALTLAHADTKITLKSHIIILLIQVPVVIFSAIQFGAKGTAAAWCLLFIIYGPYYAWAVNKRYLPSSHLSWLWRSIIKPAITALIVIISVKYIVVSNMIPNMYALIYIFLSWSLSQLLVLIFAPLPGVNFRSLNTIQFKKH